MDKSQYNSTVEYYTAMKMSKNIGKYMDKSHKHNIDEGKPDTV